MQLKSKITATKSFVDATEYPLCINSKLTYFGTSKLANFTLAISSNKLILKTQVSPLREFVSVY